jgi:formylglycine-generating enzyme required for sulfatase activity
MVLVQGGRYKPILLKGKEIEIKEFYIDQTPVTNRQFSKFVKKNVSWSKTKPLRLFADNNYLKHWKQNDSVADSTLEDSPVVNISWFAAKAYCEFQSKQLPTIDQWEYLAQFGPLNQNKDVNGIILEWYSKPTPKKIPKVKSTFQNKFGVWDVHGLIWEWNYDFNTTFVTGESRGDTALEKSMFCGSGSIGAANPKDYAAFMRFGFRSSLKANYTVENLGFRCVKEK